MWFQESRSVLRHLKDYPYGIGKSDEINLQEMNYNPLVLVHGFSSNHSIWKPLSTRFELLGWNNVYRFNYHVFRSSIRSIVLDFERYMRDLIVAYDNKVSLIGHSLGGIVIRDWVTRRSNAQWVDKVVTIGSPNSGSKIAHVGRLLPCRTRKIAKELIPGSDYLNELNSRPQPKEVKWCVICSDKDELLYPVNSALYPKGWDYTQMTLKKMGHIYLAYSIETTLLCHKFLSLKQKEEKECI